jgi:hypothetical protein
MDIIQLYEDFSLDYKTEGHKHCRPGFVNVECPFCTGNPGYHLSFNIKNKYFLCWRCGWHPIANSISELLHVDKTSAITIVKKYGELPDSYLSIKEATTNALPHRLPSGVTPLLKSHKKYLINRNFDPDQLEKDWGLISCGPMSTLTTTQKTINYSHRILIPIHWNGEQVSWQTRDVTGKTDLRYAACPEEREIIKHKHVLYGKQEKWGNMGILVEGVTDVYRLGFNAFCSFGIKYTAKQLRLIAATFVRVPVMFDDDPQAIVQAQTIIDELLFRKVDSFMVKIKGDPASLPQKEANYIVKHLLKKKLWQKNL